MWSWQNREETSNVEMRESMNVGCRGFLKQKSLLLASPILKLEIMCVKTALQ